MTDIGTLDGNRSFAYDINDNGQIVGYSDVFAPGTSDVHAFLYDKTEGMLDLNNLIPSDSGWELYTAIAINSSGQIVGHGGIGDESRAYLLTPVPELYYVDGVYGSDDNDGLTEASAFATIQFGIDLADDGDSVLVWSGVYFENVDFAGKAITVRGVGGVPVIDGDGDFGVSFFSGEGADSVLKNFVVTGSYMGVFVAGSSPTICNVNIIGNKYGIDAYAGAWPDIVNCIFLENTDDDLFGCQGSYSCIEREDQAVGEGNISELPLFADPNNGDYRLLSEYGRYMPDFDLWVIDEVTSPCVNTGDPAMNPVDEPMGNGGRINIGAYGGTTEASRGPWALQGDLNRDGIVNVADFAIMAENWLGELVWMQ